MNFVCFAIFEFVLVCCLVTVSQYRKQTYLPYCILVPKNILVTHVLNCSTFLHLTTILQSHHRTKFHPMCLSSYLRFRQILKKVQSISPYVIDEDLIQMYENFSNQVALEGKPFICIVYSHKPRTNISLIMHLYFQTTTLPKPMLKAPSLKVVPISMHVLS